MLASLRDTSHAITRLERVVAGDVGVDSAERLATEINQVPKLPGESINIVESESTVKL